MKSVVRGTKTARSSPRTSTSAQESARVLHPDARGRRGPQRADRSPPLHAQAASARRSRGCCRPADAELVFEDLCEAFDAKLGIIVDAAAASGRGLTADVNAAEFEHNAEALARDLGTLGLLTAYSDATRMVRGEVHR